MKHLLIAASLCLTPLAYADTAPASQPQATTASQALSHILFLYSRAAYLHDVMVIRSCDQLNGSAVNAIDQRFANARTKILAVYGKYAFKHSPPTSTAMALACDRDMIRTYDDQVSELEKTLNSPS